MQLGTFTAQILVDGKPLEEYDIVSESPTKVTCWVASEEGKSFGVQWKCHEQFRVTASQGSLYVDGIGCGAVLMHPGAVGVRDTSFLSHLVHSTTKRDLMFARIQLSDDDSLLSKEVPKNVGQITLQIRRGREVKKFCAFDRRRSGAAVPGNSKFHERSKKATVHCVGFGAELPRERPAHIWTMVPNNEPAMNFVFNYQPLAVLQANGVAPRPISNDPSANSEIDTHEHHGRTPDDTTEDVKPFRLDDRILNLENELKRLREMKASDSEDRKPKRIKREEQGERRRPVFAPGEIIDLT